MDSWLNYHHLFYFKTIATEGSIAKAAIKLRLGQPTLSTQLKQFEEKLGVSLFDRQHKKLILTEHGKIALEYALEIFKIGTEMQGVLSERLVPNKIQLNLGILDGISKRCVFKLIESALNFAPCRISSLEGRTEDLLRELLNSRIDLILTNHRPPAIEGRKLQVKQLLRSPMLVCGSKKYRSLKKNFPRSLNKAPVILPTLHSRIRHEIEHFFDSEKLSPDRVVEAEDFALQRLLATEGVGLIFITQKEYEMIPRGDLEIIGQSAGIFSELYLISSSRKIENPVAAHLIKTIVF